MFKKVRTVIYKVRDLQVAKAWYQDITGVTPYFDEPFYVGFNIDGCELGLDPDMSYTSTGNQAIAYWAVDNLDEALLKLFDSGATIVQPKTNVGGTINVATVLDPFGNHVGLITGA